MPLSFFLEDNECMSGLMSGDDIFASVFSMLVLAARYKSHLEQGYKEKKKKKAVGGKWN